MSKSEDREVNTGDSSPIRVLLIDDDALILRSLARVLRTSYVVETASSGERALEILAENTFDVILSDVMMPGMTGVDLFREIRSRHPELESRFAFLTAGSSSATAGNPFAMSVPVLPKPVSLRYLEAMIRALCSRKPLRAV